MLRIRSKVGPKGQAVIPKPVREALGIQPGDMVYFSAHEGHAHLEKGDGGDWDNYWKRMPTVKLPAGFDVDAAIEAGLDAELRDEAE